MLILIFRLCLVIGVEIRIAVAEYDMCLREDKFSDSALTKSTDVRDEHLRCFVCLAHVRKEEVDVICC